MKTVLITGASRGIGRAIALRLGSEGYALALHYRQQQAAARSLLGELGAAGAQCRLLQFDIADREQTAAVLSADIEAHGAYYGVVANAGLNRDNAFPALSGEDWDVVVHTNLDGLYNVLHPLIMPMIRRRQPGRIVTLSSVSGQVGTRGQVNYSAAKAGIIGATKALAIELASRKITVNCVAPGLIHTEMTDAMDERARHEALQQVPMKRMGEPAEVAGVVSFLLSDDAAYLTRQVIAVNGGMH